MKIMTTHLQTKVSFINQILIEIKQLAQERQYIREWNFTSHGSRMKILLYDRNHDSDDSMGENERAKAVFMSRDDRVYRMAAIKNKPDTINFITNHLFSNNIIGEPEVIRGDVLLVVDQVVHQFSLPYALRYNKSVLKPEVYLEKAIDRAREILELNNDICSDTALMEYLNRKGIPESWVWILSVLIKSKLMKEICKWVILANAIKRIVDKEVYVTSNINGKHNIPQDTYANTNQKGISPLFTDWITYVIESIVQNNLEEESKLAKNLLMTLFFYRLESLPFHNGLQFDIETKEYLQGKVILKDIIKVATDNPLLFLKTIQNVCNVKFSSELLRKWGIDKYFIGCPSPLQIETGSDEVNVDGRMVNYGAVSVRERMYFVMASFISTREYMDINEDSEEYSRPTHNSSSIKNSYLDDDEDDEGESSSISSRKSSDDGSNEYYDSVASLNNQSSPPFKQAKFDKNERNIK